MKDEQEEVILTPKEESLLIELRKNAANKTGKSLEERANSIMEAVTNFVLEKNIKKGDDINDEQIEELRSQLIKQLDLRDRKESPEKKPNQLK